MSFQDHFFLSNIVRSKEKKVNKCLTQNQNQRMKLFNLLTCALLLFFGTSSSLQAQCTVSFSYTNTGNNYNFTTTTSAGILNPVYVWTIDDYNNNTTNTITTTTPAINYNFTGGSPFGFHYACLTVYDSLSNCQATFCDSVYTNTTNPCSGFSVTHSNTVSGNTASFTSNVTGGTPTFAYVWNFHGLGSSSLANPSFTYPGPGWYAADLTVYDTMGCQTSYHDSVYIASAPCSSSSASFQYTTSGNSVAFNSSTSGFFPPWTQYVWDFGNGSYSYTANPTTQLSTGWNYVCLTVTDSICTDTYCDTIYVSGNTGSNPCANHSVSYTSSVSGNNVTLVGSSTGYVTGGYYINPSTNAYLGAGPNLSLTLANGTYLVCYHADEIVYDSITNVYDTCSSVYCDSIYVNNSGNPCNTSVWFVDSSYAGGTDFYPITSGFQSGWESYYWDFGNGTVSYNQYPSTQLANGWYYVCLTVTDSICTDTYCDSVYINNGTNPCNTNVSFFDSIRVGNDITFHASSYGFDPAFTSYSWDFGNGIYAYGQSPTVNLPNGWYYGCLTVTDSICTETYCDSIYVSTPCTQNSVTLNLLFDNYATETSWTVTDANGAVVANGGGYSSIMNGQNLPIDLCLPAGCYNFNIYDSYGDGICCLYGNGNYTLLDNTTGNTLVSGGAFTYAETTNFCVGGSSNPCGNFGNGSFSYTVGANGVVTFAPVLASNQYPLNFAWDFGNGNVSSSSNPSFTFANGYHLVCVTADSGNCTFTYCDTIMVTTNNGNPTGPCANLTTDINITQSINDPLLLWMQPVINGAAANAGFTFVWDFGDNTGAMSGAPLHTYNAFGSYVVCLMALDTVNGCVSTFCDTITMDSSGNFSRNFTKPGFTVNILPPVINYYTAVDQVETADMDINLFPNPANSVVNLVISSEEAIDGTVSILDLTGKVAYTNNLNVAAGQEQVSLPVEELPSGVYLVRITSETAQQTLKFIKE